MISFIIDDDNTIMFGNTKKDKSKNKKQQKSESDDEMDMDNSDDEPEGEEDVKVLFPLFLKHNCSSVSLHHFITIL